MSNGQPIRAAQLRIIIALAQDNQPNREIAAVVGCSVSSVSYWMARLPAARRPRACVRCGHPFVPYRPGHRYCSEYCREHDPHHVCREVHVHLVTPEEAVTMRRERAEEGLAYAEIGARHQIAATTVAYWLQGRERAALPKGQRKTRVPRTCGMCGVRFSGVANQRYCSPRCQAQRQLFQRVLKRGIARPCARCGQTFRGKRLRYCSAECVRAAHDHQNREWRRRCASSVAKVVAA